MESASTTAPRKTSKISQKRGKGLPRRAQDLSKEELLLTLQKKRECNARALKIVEGMLEPNVQDDWFLDVLQHLNQSHYQDITEERAITKLCGYPLCSAELKNIPSQQYRISTRLNKVYDIKERKNFCSNKCFRASNYIKDQMHTSPLWLRDIEPNVKFTLMPSTGSSGGAGEEVPVQVERVTREQVKELSGLEKSSFSSRDEHKATPSSENRLADVLSNLHLVASIRKNSSSFISEMSEVPEGKEETALTETTMGDKKEEVGEKDTPNKYHVSSTDALTGNNSDEATLKLMTVKNDKKEFVCDDSQTGNYIPETKPSNPTKEESSSKISNVLDVLANISKHEVSKTPSIDEALCEISDGNTGVMETSLSSLSLTQLPSSEEILTLDVNITEKVSSSCPETINQTVKTLSSDDCSSIVVKKIDVLPNFSSNILHLNSAPAPEKILKESRNLSSDMMESARKLCPEKCETAQSSSTKNSKTAENTSRKTQFKLDSHKSGSVVSHVEKCVEEWFTMETMCFLFGERALKDMLEQKGESIQEHYKALRSLTWDQEKHERFLTICKQLNLLEMEDNNFDNQVMKSEAEQRRKPLPDYDALKKEAEVMELKIKAFYGGKMETEDKKVSFELDVKTDSKEDQDHQPQIPLVHLHAQRALRKKIVLGGLNRVLPDFLRTFGMRPSELTGSIRGLVSTFAFSPLNITFKPHEWSLLGLIIIKLLALREPELKLCLQREQSNTYMTLMLMSYKQEPGYLDRLLSWLTDIDKLLAKPPSSGQM